MPKKVQRKPIRYRSESISERPTVTNTLGIQEAVTILGGITGVIVAILWLGGRFFTAGYFSAMNIPSFEINYSIWEYAEVSWFRLFFYFLEKIYKPLVLIAAVFLTISFLTAVLQRIFQKLRLDSAVKNLELATNKLRNEYRPVLWFSLSMYFLYLMLLAFVDINSTGYTLGRNYVLFNSHSIEVYSKNNLPLGTGSVLPNVSPTLIKYNDLHLLTYNNGKYYLFREVDPVTCKPAQVFIISDSQDAYIVLGDKVHINSTCISSSASVSKP